MLRSMQRSDWSRHPQIYKAASSLGGVESLIEYRVRVEPSADPRLLRLSVGLEDFEDLKDDMRRGFNAVANTREHINIVFASIIPFSED
jgi:cystathionine beta-lyase/cystathionine gamma-synthase